MVALQRENYHGEINQGHQAALVGVPGSLFSRRYRDRGRLLELVVQSVTQVS